MRRVIRSRASPQPRLAWRVMTDALFRNQESETPTAEPASLRGGFVLHRGGALEEKTVASEVVFSGRVVTLRVDTVRLDGGRETKREIVSSRGAVAIVAWDPLGQLLLVRQYRKAVERELWELPAGTLEPGENPLHCAARELEEETGYRAGRIRPLLSIFTSPGFCSEMLHLYEAHDLSAGHAAPEEDENLVLARVPLQDAMAMIERGEIVDAKTLVGILMAARRHGWDGHV